MQTGLNHFKATKDTTFVLQQINDERVEAITLPFEYLISPVTEKINGEIRQYRNQLLGGSSHA